MPGSLFDGLSPAQFAVCKFISDSVRKAYELKISFENPDALKAVERYTILSAIDKLWQEHLYEMDSLRNSIGLRAYGQRDPLIEYKAEAFKIFEELMVNIKTEICHNIFRSASSLMAFEKFPAQRAATHRASVHQRLSAARPRPHPAAAIAAAAAKGQRHGQRSRRRQCPRPSRSAAARKSAATILALAAAGRNTSSAAGRMAERVSRAG